MVFVTAQLGVAGPAQVIENDVIDDLPLRHRPAQLYDDVFPAAIDDSMLMWGRGRGPAIVRLLTARRRPPVVIGNDRHKRRPMFVGKRRYTDDDDDDADDLSPLIEL